MIIPIIFWESVMKRELGVVGKGNITAIRELNNLEYEEYKKAATRLLRFSSDSQTFLIVLLNYEDYESLLNRYFKKYTKNASISWDRMENMVLEINRRVINYLSAIRTFLDHSKTKLNRRYGRDSERVKRFKNACSEAYESNFSYRFLYALRNYAQHCGMPLGQITLSSKEISPHSGEVYHSLAVKFERDELLSSYDKWGSQLKKEIQKLPPTFEINPHVTEMMRCIEKIFLVLIHDELPGLTKSAEYVHQLVREAKSMSGTPCILVPKILQRSREGEVKELEMNIEWMPLHLVKIIMNVKARLGSSKPA